MAAVGGPVLLGVAVAAPGAPGAAAVAPIVPPGPTPFTNVIMTAIGAGIDPSGYELSYPVFIASLQPSLLHHYPPPGAARAAPVVAAAAPVAVGNSIEYVRTFYDFVRANRPNPANIWTTARIRTLFDNARIFVDGPAPGPALVYNAAAPIPYKAAIQAYVNNAANQIDAGIPGGNVVTPLNIGP